jgi:hypothetical protein
MLRVPDAQSMPWQTGQSKRNACANPRRGSAACRKKRKTALSASRVDPGRVIMAQPSARADRWHQEVTGRIVRATCASNHAYRL